MKRKIGEIYNKSIVEGDKNLKTKNEIHVDELSNNSGGGNKLNYSSKSQDDLALLYNKLNSILGENEEFFVIKNLGITIDDNLIYQVNERARTNYDQYISYNTEDYHTYGVVISSNGDWCISDFAEG